jgi:uncharacterized protein (TIGR03437 family)
MNLPNIWQTLCLLATVVLGPSLLGQSLAKVNSVSARPVGLEGLRTPYFEENMGHLRKDVRFIVRGKSGTTTITDCGLEFPGGSKISWVKPSTRLARTRVRGAKPRAGKSHYLVGSDPAKWTSNVRHFGEISVASAFPGVDVRLYFLDGNLEYDLIIAPGASPSVIHFETTGWARIVERPDGSLRFESRYVAVTQRPPYSYQRINEEVVPVASRFRVSPDQRYITVSVDGIDAAHPFVIDPAIEMSLLMGGNNFDTTHSVQSDSKGNIYICGTTRSTDLPVRSSDSFNAPFDFSQNGRVDAFVAKLSSTGDLLSLTYLGSRGDDEAYSIAVATDSSIYVSGNAGASDFPVKSGFDQSFNGTGLLLSRSSVFLGDGFVARISADGSTLMSSTFLGGSESDGINSIAIGVDGSVVAVGQTTSPHFPTTTTLLPRTNPVYADAFVVQLSASLDTLQFSTVFGGYFSENATGVGVDDTGAIWLCGTTNSNDFGVLNAMENQRRGLNDGFLVKIAPSRRSVVTSTFIGGSRDDIPQSLVLDGAGDVYVAGVTNSSNFPVLLPIQGSLKGSSDAFVLKVNSLGTRILFSTYLGGTAAEENASIALGPRGEIVVSGSTYSLDFPVVDPTSRKGSNSTEDTDGFISAISPVGNQLLFSMYVGGSSYDYLNSVIHQGSHVVAVGGTASANFPYTKAIKPNRRLPGIQGGIFDYDATIVRLRLDTDVTPEVIVDGIRNAASFDNSLSPGAWASIFGKNFLPDSSSARVWNSTDFTGSKLPESLEGVSVLFDGRPAAISFVSASQLNVQVPDVPQSALTRVDVRSPLGLASAQVAVKTSSPSLFTIAPFGSGRLVAAVYGDGRLVGSPNIVPGSRPARPGDTILLFGTGFGPTSPAQASGFVVVPSPLRGRCIVRIGNQVAEVLYSGLVGPGLNQINIRIPNIGPGDYQIVVAMDAEQTQTGVILPIGQ